MRIIVFLTILSFSVSCSKNICFPRKKSKEYHKHSKNEIKKEKRKQEKLLEKYESEKQPQPSF